MNRAELIDKYRNKAVNIGVILVFLIVAGNIHKGSLARIESLKAKISEEGKKSGELLKINQLEGRIMGYKKLLAKKEASLVMGNISDIAKSMGVEVLSVKPLRKELPGADYTKDVFDVSVNAPSYDALARFISGVESSSNVYTIDNIGISPQPGPDGKGLTANLKISSVSATN
ncbi:MAG: hypothetical protein WC937_06035 [Candidatus Omnitrophota bacterium]|jgi:Tfp pilus assembly protein PilO